MMNYNILPTNKKDDWEKTLTYFATFCAMQKAYLEDRATESGFEIAANINHIAPTMSVVHASTNPNTGGMIGTPEYEAKIAYHDYVKGLE